jgi:3-deoxy-D-manno-octulosonate 8-phosphate phosphatase (KDO 8-P phosphatase)
MKNNYKQRLGGITTFLFDVDGVFTDGVVWLMANGEQVRTANVKDGYAVQLAVKKGFRIVIISGGNSEAVRLRFQGLGVTDVFLSSHDKWEVYEGYMEKHNLKPEEILYMGDDIVDYQVLKAVGVSTCPYDAAEEIREMVDYVSPKSGGKGCVRDVIEQTLKVQGKWMDADAHQW